MITHISFAGELLNLELFNGRKSTSSHVLVYGAIEFHSSGPLGCIASNKSIAESTGLKESTVANIISTIAKSGWINVTVNSQNKRLKIEPLLTVRLEKPASPTGEAGHHPPVKINNNINNSIKDIDKSISKKDENPKYDDEDIRLANLLFKLMKDNHDHITRSPNENDFKTISRLRRIDNRDVQSIEYVIRWSQQDDFWSSNILSVQKLRKQFDQLVIKIKQDRAKAQRNTEFDIRNYS